MKKLKVVEQAEEAKVEETLKVAPLTLNVSGQLGNENLALVVDKLNEVIAFLNK